MIEDLRQQASESFENDAPASYTPRPPARFLGMTPIQTFAIALLLLLLTCVLSASCLLVTGRVAPPLFG
ncbi:MAG: hypothetical protein B6D39_01885 [Anaerolineae bacterium UTCFX2]|jgi:hypothetical protein|nr:hypothetical protein [Anaerolineae bacterium]MCZ7552715.1 hypothetical protein [Anaerolineales bacterium]OQY94256.1 MAG: hypothetical protein B6D39_01885 [Anaerolineae bacterium UTCFX2]